MKIDIDNCFMPECYLDTLLAEVLLKVSYKVNHTKGNNNVALKMQSADFVDGFAVGIIDKDKIEIAYLKEFELIGQLSFDMLKFYAHRNEGRKHFFIVICPAIEKWILTECEAGNVKLEDYSLPGDLKGLRILKDIAQRSDRRFANLFKQMLKQEGCKEIRALQKWLLYLKEKNYQADINELSNV
jgi:hypothetical protein